MNQKQLFIFVLGALILVMACGNALTFAGKCVETSSAIPPKRIASLSPSVSEILYGVGAFSRVVAVSDYDTYPPEAKNLPHIGGWQNINLEQIAALKLDLAVMTDAEAPLVKDKLDALCIKTLVVPSRTIEDALAAIEQIGRAVGNEERARELAKQTRLELDAVRTITLKLKRPRVLCVVDRAPGTLRDIYTASEGSFLAQLIDIAGGESIAPSSSQGYGKINKEAIVGLNPDIIIDMVQGQEGQFAENPQEVWKELNQTRAVRDGRVYSIRDTSVLHPSQFIAQTARKFAEIIHPEISKSEFQK